MSKSERLRKSWFLTIDKIINKYIKPTYRVTVLNQCGPGINAPEPIDECVFTEEAWADLEEYFRSNKSGIIWRPFTEQEQEEAWIPRFSGMNPDLIEYTRWGWNAAFEYVNDQILKKKLQEETK